MSGLKVLPRIVELFEAVCSRQFGNLGAYIKKYDEDYLRMSNMDDFVSALIEADSEDLSIKMYLSVPGTFLRETMPLVEVNNDSIVQYQEDWCMELANRFLGDLKNQLLSQNCVLKMGLPKLLEENVMNIELSEGYDEVQRLFVVDSHLLAQVHDLPLAFSLHVQQINKGLVFVEDDDDFDDDDCFEMSELEHL